MGFSPRVLTEPAAMELLGPYGVPFPSSFVATSPREAETAAATLGAPLALKIVSPDIQHKTDVGGVLLGILASDVAESYDRLIATVGKRCPQATIDGVLIQSQAAAGIEIIAGIKRDREFGQVILLGAGGVFAELLDDVALRLVPIDEKKARQMIEQTAVHKLLSGARGGPKSDIEALCHVLVALSQAAHEHPEIIELDMNPILVHAQGATAVDALVLIDDEA